jgi:RNA polymerase sigma factor (sigma-70 family)
MSSGFVDITTNSEAEGLFLLAPLHTTMLVVDAKNGNEQAFELLVKRHLRKILSVALGFTRSQGDAEDIAQRSLQEAFVHLRTLEGKSSFCPWLTRIAINESRIFLRRSRGQREISIDEDLLIWKQWRTAGNSRFKSRPGSYLLAARGGANFVRCHEHLEARTRKGHRAEGPCGAIYRRDGAAPGCLRQRD